MPPSEVSQAALRQLDHALWAPTTARHWHCRPGDIPIYLRFLAIAVVALQMVGGGGRGSGCRINDRRREREEAGLGKKVLAPLPTKVKRSTGGRTQQIRLRLSPTFPKILAMGESETDRDRGREPLAT